MVAHLLSLKWRLLLNGFKRGPWQIVGIVLGGVYALGVVLVLVSGLIALHWADAVLAQTIVVLGGAAAMLGWMLVPLLASAADMTLDPSRFTSTAVPPRQLLTGLAMAGFIGIPGLATAVVSLATVVTWWHSVPAVVGAVLGAGLGAMTCVVLSKVVTTATASLAASRKFKDISSLVVFVPLMFLGPLAGGIMQGLSAGAGYLPGLARTLSWTPVGAAWSLGGEMAAGNAGTAALKFLIAGATLAGLFLAWHVLLQRALVTPPYSGGTAKKGGKPGLFGIVPGTPTGAVAARSLTYWLRDPRYAGSLVVVPLLPVLFLLPGVQTGNFEMLSVLGPMTAFLLAWSISADVSYDSTAFALHLAAGVRGIHDRMGRALACLAFSLPVSVLFAVGPFFITGNWSWLPNILGLTLGILFTGLGLSSIISAGYVVAVPLPGESPFKKPPGNVAQTLTVQMLGMAVLFVLVAPELGLVIVQAMTGNAVAAWINLVLGPVLGLAFFAIGVRIGGKWLDAKGPELYAQLTLNR